MDQAVVRSHLALLLAMLIWGSSFIALKISVTNMAPMVVIFLRLLIGAITFIALWRWLNTRFRYQPGDWKYLLGMALFEPCLYFVFESNALKYTSAGQASMIIATLPLMVAVAAYIFFKERNTARQWCGFLCAVAGVFIMTLASSESEQAPNALLGNSLELLAAISAVGYTMLVKHLTQRYSAFLLTAIQHFVGALFFLPLALVSPWPGQMTPAQGGAILYLGLIVSIGAYGLYNYSLTHLKASTAASYINLLAVFTLLFSMLLLGERLTIVQCAAIALVFFGVFLSQQQKA